MTDDGTPKKKPSAARCRGIRVLDLSAYIAGPYGLHAAGRAWERAVIKIEPPTGDNLRKYPSTLETESRAFVGVNRNKRGLALDLKKPEGLEVLHRLLGEADVLTPPRHRKQLRLEIFYREGLVQHFALLKCLRHADAAVSRAEHKRQLPCLQNFGNGKNKLTVEIDVEDREIECICTRRHFSAFARVATDAVTLQPSSSSMFSMSNATPPSSSTTSTRRPARSAIRRRSPQWNGNATAQPFQIKDEIELSTQDHARCTVP